MQPTSPKTLFLFLALISMPFVSALGQVKVGENPTTIDSSAVLELESTTHGFLPPRMTTAQRDAINLPAQGLILYNITIPCLQVNNGTPSNPLWECLLAAAPALEISSNGTGIVSTYAGPGCAGQGAISGAMVQGVSVSGVTMEIYADVSQLGTWNISAVENGVTFSGNGTFSTLGCQLITLTGTGTPTASGPFTWTTNTTPSVSADATVSAGGNPSSGGTAEVTSWTGEGGCRVGAGSNNSPAGVTQGGVNNTMVQGEPLPFGTSITLTANVSTAGTYSISTNTVNGVTFSASGTFGATGNQPVVLTPSGIPAAAGNYIWTLGTSPSINSYGSVLTTNAPLGSTYSSHYNGIVGGVHNVSDPLDPTYYLLSTYSVGETFDNNPACIDKAISAQGCGGITDITTPGGNSYNTIQINGQCWLLSNLQEEPDVYNAYNESSWTNVEVPDNGYWGYYNVSDNSGSSGWGATEPAAGEGMLYQWCGAMNASISERSKGVCPVGWHVPSDCEWMYLEHGVGMEISEQVFFGAFPYRSGSDDSEGVPGYKLLAQGLGSNNASFFGGLLAGGRFTDGFFGQRGGNFGSLYLWSSTATSTTLAYYRDLSGGNRGIGRNELEKPYAFSVRCLKD